MARLHCKKQERRESISRTEIRKGGHTPARQELTRSRALAERLHSLICLTQTFGLRITSETHLDRDWCIRQLTPFTAQTIPPSILSSPLIHWATFKGIAEAAWPWILPAAAVWVVVGWPPWWPAGSVGGLIAQCGVASQGVAIAVLGQTLGWVTNLWTVQLEQDKPSVSDC